MTAFNHYVLTMEGISKSFYGVQALENVDFALQRGEIHALVGENGAGKSTLIKVLTGAEHADQGEITLAGEAVFIRSPQHAQAMGISTVYQEISLCTNLTVAENILIGREPMKLGRIDWKAMNNLAAEMLARFNIDIDVTLFLGAYPIAIQQLVAIARALAVPAAKVLILDEPTSSLNACETRQLFQVMRQLKAEGMGIIFITHFLDQVYEVADRITVLRNGRRVGVFATEALPRLKLVAKMIGRTLDEFDDMTQIRLASAKRIPEKTLLAAADLGLTGEIAPFDLELHAGEVLGLAGLLGSGRTEIAYLLFGIAKPDQGTLILAGKKIDKFSPRESIARGITFCPKDRRAEGVLGDLTVRENIVLALQAKRGWFKNLGKPRQYELADNFIKILNIDTSSADQLVKNLSAGNQQKVLLARWLATDPQILILDEPTRGIDVGTKTEIQKLVLELADEGRACIFISSELAEVLRTSHRIAVLRDRKKVAEFRGGVEEQTLMQSMVGSEA
ncbi:MAG: sugar ABC transporter ATP-binding protein [Anaerolineales bacterium]|nr:sugar ABC transporter ATP-binding protein [Anaerolineales bacterium]